MPDWLTLGLSFMAGLVMGYVYFLGLWLTVVHLQRAKRPVFLAATSFLIRVSIILGLLGLISAGAWQRLPLALLGFLLAREVLRKHYGNRVHTGPES